MEVKLIVQNKNASLNELVLRRARTVVGRKKGCKVRIRSAEVSRIHCVVTLENDQLMVKDLGSTNGTFVNGQRVSTTVLLAGDMLGVGPLQFMIQIDGLPPLDGESCEIVGDEAFLSDTGDVIFSTVDDATELNLDNIEEFIVPTEEGTRLDLKSLTGSMHPAARTMPPAPRDPPRPSDQAAREANDFLVDDDKSADEPSAYGLAHEDAGEPGDKRRKRH